MKKAFVTVIALVLMFAVAAFAQETTTTTTTETGLTHYGIKVGASLANLTGSDAKSPFADTLGTGISVSKKMLIGFAAGLFADYQIAPQFAVAVEPMYVMKGAKYEATLGTVKETAKLKLSYIEIPVLAKFMPTMTGNIKPSIFAGPFVGLRMSAKVSDGASVDVKDNVKSTDFGIAFGAGVAYGMTKGAITLDARYDLGLSKIGKAPSGGTAPNIKTSAILVMLGYSIK